MKMQENNKVVVLSGGVGGAKFLEGLTHVMPQKDIYVIVNTGDDKEFYGLYVSPDTDIILYTLSGEVNKQQGWGMQKDTYHTMKQLTRLGYEGWFLLGDKDLATHIHRTHLLKSGKSLSKITDILRNKFGLQLQIVPMSDQTIQTFIQTKNGLIHFEEYFVKHKAQNVVIDILYKGIDKAYPAPGIIDAILGARAIVIAPSNPLVSIGTILAVPGIRQALNETTAKTAAVSPIIRGKAIKGPAGKMMEELGMDVSPLGIARYYKDFLDIMIIDEQDKVQINDIEKLGIQTIAAQTIMKDLSAKKILAESVLKALLV